MEKNLLYALPTTETPIEEMFEHLFKSHFKALHGYAFTILKEEITAEEVVQNVFCKLWEKREQIEIKQSMKAYLYRSVHNESLNHLKHEKVKNGYHNYALRNINSAENSSQKMMYSQLEIQLHKAMNELPEQCRTVFQLSRFEELKYREIADAMGLSIKTVENHMGKALRLLRTKLIDFLPALILSLLNL